MLRINPGAWSQLRPAASHDVGSRDRIEEELTNSLEACRPLHKDVLRY